MHKYFIKTPWLVKKVFGSYIWSLPANDNAVYLSFDDGPHPTITPWVLDMLNEYGAKASFFCIGKNVEAYPEIYERILAEGHAVGNHTQHHLNGWKTDDAAYVEDAKLAARHIQSNLFRPPYGRLRSSQAKALPEALKNPALKIIMWEVLSGDFDPGFSPEQCFENVAKNVRAGSIVVFHDSEKAFTNLEFALPATLKYLREMGFVYKKIE